MKKLEICNWALIKLGQRPLQKQPKAVSAQHPNWVLCKALLEHIHRSILRTYLWNFATCKDALAPTYDDSSKGTIYEVPNNCIRVLAIDKEGHLSGDHILVSHQCNDSLNFTSSM